MKKCASCQKDIPDTAMHCVFCGAKQPPVAAPAAPAGGPGGANAKTVMGWQAADMLAGLQGKPTLVPGAQSVPAGPPPSVPAAGAPPQPAGGPPPAASPGSLGHAATLAVT
ncbi:MAG TPA: hypothetical protein VHE35_27755, partial [Kofleriaceae bacterium]|nr:hypothetical protein [Kofleriaceae bacterium]